MIVFQIAQLTEGRIYKLIICPARCDWIKIIFSINKPLKNAYTFESWYDIEVDWLK